MKMPELKDLTTVELTAKSRDLRREIFNLRLQQASAQLEKPARLRTLRRDMGEVISNKMTKTIVVRVERRLPHPKFRKVVTDYNKFYAHDEKGEAKLGDRVRIIETRPLSKTKRWRLVEVIERKEVVAPIAL